MGKRDMKNNFKFALKNISLFGDTDIFPFPIENLMFYDTIDSTTLILEEMFKDFEKYINTIAPVNESMLVASGYNSFRWATQIEPIWNAFLLGLVLSISNEIENYRIPKEQNIVFSYRLKLDEEKCTLFDDIYGWRKFQEESVNKAGDNKFVLICDISNFYSNIYHHRLENSLAKLNINDKRIEKSIMELLQKFSDTKSYGLPVGGQAARILAELLLSRTDKLLRSNNIQFCRFVDDYHIFAQSEEELYKNLLFLSETLINNEGLYLQNSKTRIMKSDEFIKYTLNNLEGTSKEGANKKNLFAISLKYDPYSANPDEEYESLQNEISKLDLLGILSEELGKSRVHTALMKKLISGMRYLEKDALGSAILSLIDSIDLLSPLFPNIAILFISIYDQLESSAKIEIDKLIYKLIYSKSYLVQVEINLLYCLRLISKNHTDETETLLTSLYTSSSSMIARREVILIMAKWGCDFWLSDLKNRYQTLTVWEKRSFILASFYLGDEGKHWRTHNKDSFSKIDMIYRDWICTKIQTPTWRLPV